MSFFCINVMVFFCISAYTTYYVYAVVVLQHGQSLLLWHPSCWYSVDVRREASSYTTTVYKIHTHTWSLELWKKVFFLLPFITIICVCRKDMVLLDSLSSVILRLGPPCTLLQIWNSLWVNNCFSFQSRCTLNLSLGNTNGTHG